MSTTITCAIHYHSNTGDAELIVYQGSMRTASYSYAEEDGGLRAAKAMAAKLSPEKPFIRTI